MKLWKEFHDTLSDKENNEIPKKLQGIDLKIQLGGRAFELVSSISGDGIRKEVGALTFAQKVHKVNLLSQVCAMTDQYWKLLDTVR